MASRCASPQASVWRAAPGVPWRQRVVRRASSRLPLPGPRVLHCRTAASASGGEGGDRQGQLESGTLKDPQVLLTSMAYVVLSIVNRVVYRMSLVPMHRYTFFLSLFVTFMYVAAYGMTLAARRRAGIVGEEQLRWALSHLGVFAVIGSLEATTFVLGMYAAATLPGALLSVLSQSVLVFIAMASYFLLGRRYSMRQVSGLLLVVLGVVISIFPQTASQLAHETGGLRIWAMSAVFSLSYAFAATASVLKERVFKRSGIELDLFIVNTFSSLMQLAVTIVALPLSTALALHMARSSNLHEYLGGALSAFIGKTGIYMPWLAILYVAFNLGFNITGLRLLKIASALDATVVSMVSVPLTTLAFCLPLPILARSRFSPVVVLGLVVLLSGIWMYNRPAKRAE